MLNPMKKSAEIIPFGKPKSAKADRKPAKVEAVRWETVEQMFEEVLDDIRSGKRNPAQVFIGLTEIVADNTDRHSILRFGLTPVELLGRLTQSTVTVLNGVDKA